MPALHTKRLMAVDFAQGSTPTNPLNPPGQDYDGRAVQDLSCSYPATQQVTTITLETATIEGDITTLVITPILMADGSAWADNLGPVTVSYTTPAAANDTLDNVAKGLVQALADAGTTGTLADLANYQRVAEIVQAASDATDEIELTGTLAGATFSYEITSTGALTDDGGVTVGAGLDPIPVGFIVMRAGYTEAGIPIARLPQAGDTAADVLGVAQDSIRCEPLVAGQKHRLYVRGCDFPFRAWGSGTAYSEKAIAAIGSAAFVRLVQTAGVGEPGAVTDTGSGDHAALGDTTFLRTTPAAGSSAYLKGHP